MNVKDVYFVLSKQETTATCLSHGWMWLPWRPGIRRLAWATHDVPCTASRLIPYLKKGQEKSHTKLEMCFQLPGLS